MNLSYLNAALMAAGIMGMVVTHRWLSLYEAMISDRSLLSKYAKVHAVIIAAVLVTDLILFYRGVGAIRIAQSGHMSIQGEGVLATTSVALISVDFVWPLLRPVASTLNYLASVWHATLIGLMLASLFLTALAGYLRSVLSLGGRFKSVVLGTVLAIPQPFCSCCASPIAASIYRRGTSLSSALSFLLASPMLNITTLILAFILLPLEFALLRIGAGLLLAIPISYAVSPLLERKALVRRVHEVSEGWLMRALTFLLNRYCSLFHFEQLTLEQPSQTPSYLITTWLRTVIRIARVLLPVLIVGGVASAAIAQSLQPSVSNSLIGVLIASLAGTLLMVSTWTELPVAALFIEAGMRGPAAALLITLPAVSVPCLLIFGGALGSLRASALLGVVVFLLGLAAGILFI